MTRDIAGCQHGGFTSVLAGGWSRKPIDELLSPGTVPTAAVADHLDGRRGHPRLGYRLGQARRFDKAAAVARWTRKRAEIFAFWRATGRMGYPAGAVYRVLLLTGLRLNEAAQISWPEVQGNTIVIPASRMKGREGKAREHLLPLSSAAREVIASLPRIKNGPFLFSLKAGKAPLAMTGPIKADLDRRMLRTLKALARRRGEDHQAVDLPEWVNHDLRRVVRSGLAQLRIPHNVAEAVLAHRPPGIVGTYNLHEYEDEKVEALEKWAQHLNSIVRPPAKVPDKKIVPLRKRRR